MRYTRSELCLLIKKKKATKETQKFLFPLMNCVKEDGNKTWKTEEERYGEMLEKKCKAPGQLVTGP